MKAKRLVPGQIVNPFFSHEARREAKARGEAYTVTPLLTLPIGEVVDDPDAWKMCLGDSPVMAPVDEECRDAVLKAMGSVKRIAFLRNLARQNHPDVRKQMDKRQIEWLDTMLETYSGEIEKVDPRSPIRKPVERTTAS